MIRQHAFSLSSGNARLAATAILPEAVSGTLLFLPPFGEERNGTLPLMIHAARRWAEEGFASLIFDPSGCGDSTGEFAGTSPEQLERDAETAFRWLRALYTGYPTALIGIRTGVCLARQLAARPPNEVEALVQWAPVTGEAFLKQLFQHRMVNDMVAYGKAQESRKSLEARLANGESVDLDGYTLSAPLYRWLRTLAVPEGGETCPLPILTVTGGHDTACAATFATPQGETAELRFPPFWNTVGQVDLDPLIAETGSWIRKWLTSEPVPETAAVPDDEQAFPALSSDGGTIRLAVDRPAGEPTAGMLLLHGWSGDRTGPHRLFTRFARQRAAAGTLCVRPDFIGRGFSDGTADDAAIARMAANAETALAYLKTQLPPNAPVTVLAICSGCKVAITLAASHPDLDRLILWSAESMGSLRSAATGMRKSAKALKTYLRKLFRPETWKKLLRGQVNTGMVTKALVKHETRSAAEAEQEDAVLKRFRGFRRPILFIFGGSDPDAAGSSQAYARYCTANAIPFTLHTIPHAGHSYYSESWTDELWRLTTLGLQNHPENG